jgi:hypothetical protein
MSKEIESIVCEVCESSYKIVYDLNQTSGWAKFCPFCSEIPEQEKTKIDDDEEYDNE